MFQKNNGFTLVELALAITIISLIIGGILVGQGMIRGAQVLSAVDDVNRYKQAIQLFKDKYHYLPGDMPTAINFWGTDSNGCPNGTPGTITKQTATCNGDGNGQIGFHSVTVSPTDSALYEWFRAWQQLADAGLITGTYTGVSGPGGSAVADAIPGINVPASRIEGAGYTLYYVQPYSGSPPANDFAGTYGHLMIFGSRSAGWATQREALTPAEAYALDSKADDGLPGSGNIVTNTLNLLPNCAKDSTEYYKDYKASACDMIFILGF